MQASTLMNEHANKLRRERYARNPERIREQNRKWYAANKDRQKAPRLKWREKNKGRIKARNAKWYAANKDRAQTNHRKWLGLPKPSRVKPALCEACNGPPNGARGLVLDHCHETGAFRGWLCNSCNLALGKLGDNRAGVLNLLNYIDRMEEIRDVQQQH